MSGLFGWSSTQFDKLIEKATSNLLLEPDWDTTMQICDCVRQGDVQPKYAISCIKKKLYAQNPHVVLFTLQVLESCVKNCGAPIHAEVATRAFMEELRDVVKNNTNENVKVRILELVQAWAHAFRNQPKYRAVQDVFNLLRMEGYNLQVLKESDAMFVADTAPDWADGDCCHRCRVQFSVVQRKHHCRNCGQIFCQKCSSRASPIPRFGIEKEVRVCEACWESLSKPPATSKISTQSAESSPKQSSKPSKPTDSSDSKTEQELKEEEELQLALALSQSEAECKERPQVSKSPLHVSYAPPEDVDSIEPLKKITPSSNDGELERYLNRSYWEQRQQQNEDNTAVNPSSEKRSSPIPSAPVSSASLQSMNNNSSKVDEKYQNGDIDEMSDFLTNLRTSLEIFLNRMKSNSSRGRPIANDTYVQSQFMNITNMHSQLLKYIQEQEDSRAYYETLQDKLNQIRDARAALDALREEHQEKLRQEAEEAERQRQIQMAHKLEIMRKKKQEYLQYQRQLAIQRMQEQEREMQLRHEQQKQQYQVGPAPSFPPQQQSYVPPASQGYAVMPNPANGAVVQQFRPHMVGNAVPPPPPPHLQGGDYRQPFNMQAMSASLPQGASFPLQQPHGPANSSSAVVTSSSAVMMMHPGMMAPMPSHMMPPPGVQPTAMPQQNTPVTSVQSNMPQMIPQQQGPVAHAIVPPGHEPSMPHTELLPQREAEPLIVFD